MKKAMMLVAMLALVLAVTVPAMGQVNGSGNNNTIDCAATQVAVQDLTQTIAQIIDAGGDATNLIAVLTALQQQLEQQCGVFINDDDTTREGDTTTNDNDVTPTQALDQEGESGDVTNELANDIDGDGNLMCMPTSQNGDSGNLFNGQQAQPTQAGFDDFDPTGIETEDVPETVTDCAPTNQQSSAEL